MIRAGLWAGAAIVVGVGLFAWQRGRSDFLAIEADPAFVEPLLRDSDRGAPTATALAEVMALRELAGVDVAADSLRQRVAAYRAERDRHGLEALAVLVFAGHAPLAERLLAECGADAERIEAQLAPRPESLAVVRFRAMRARFLARLDAERGR